MKPLRQALILFGLATAFPMTAHAQDCQAVLNSLLSGMGGPGNYSGGAPELADWYNRNCQGGGQQYQPARPAGINCGDWTCSYGSHCSRVHYGRCITDGHTECNSGWTCPPGSYCHPTNSTGCIWNGYQPCGSTACAPGNYCGSRNTCMAEGADDCGNGSSCSSGKRCSRDRKACIDSETVDCNGYYCKEGYKCGSGKQCLASDAVDCGGGRSCSVGYVCRKTGGCATREELAAEKAAEEQRKREEAERRKAEAEAKKEAARQAEQERQRIAAERKAQREEELRLAKQREIDLARERDEQQRLERQVVLTAKVNTYCVTFEKWGEVYLSDEEEAKRLYPHMCKGGSSYTSQNYPQGAVTSPQLAAVALSVQKPNLQLNRNLYTDIASMPVVQPPKAGSFGSATYIPAFTTERFGGCQTFNSNDAALDSFGCPGILASRRSEPTTTPPKQSIEASDRNPFNYQPPPSAEQVAVIRAREEANAIKFRVPSLRNYPDAKPDCGWPTSCLNSSNGNIQGTYYGRHCTTCKQHEVCDLNSLTGKMDNCSVERYDCKTACRPLFQ